jgi:ferredoxin
MSWRLRPHPVILTSEVGFAPSKWGVDNTASNAESDESVRKGFSGEGSSRADTKSICTLLQWRLGKGATLFPSGHHTELKRRALSPSSNKPNNEKRVHFPEKCHFCGRICTTVCEEKAC